MLNHVIAKEFIESLEQFHEFEISILDHNAILIYSTNKKREVYNSLLIDGFNTDISENGYFKADHKDGIIVPLSIEQRNVGYLIIIGVLNDIKPISCILKMALEIRLKYEESRVKEQEVLSVNAQIIQELITYSAAKKQKIQELFEASDFEADVIRIVLLLIPAQRSFLDTLPGTNFYFDSDQDIIAVYKEGIIILKDCSKYKISNESDYVAYVKKYIHFLKNYTIFQGSIYADKPIKQYEYFKSSYQQCFWLYENLKKFQTLKDGAVYFFKDYIDLFFQDSIPYELYCQVYNPVLSRIKHFDADEFLSVMKVIIKNNYNLSQSSKDLFMHKNTLIYKMEKYKKLFYIDPINSEADRTFIKNLYYYLLIKKSTGGDSYYE